jgi:hypothetical protein
LVDFSLSLAALSLARARLATQHVQENPYMKKLVIGAVALVIASQLISVYYLNHRIRFIACLPMRQLCELRCDRALSDTLDRNDGERMRRAAALQLAILDCNGNPDPAARARCAQEVTSNFQEEMARLDASDAAARATRDQCVEECRREYEACRAGNDASLSTGAVSASVDVVGPGTIDCVEGGAPCFRPVSDFCQRASGSCDQCWLSMCGGGEWTIETVGNQLPLNTTLVAALDPSKNPRVLATSTTRGNQAVLNVPPNIKLGEGEQLYFGFSSEEKRSGPVQVRIRRNK